MCTPRLGDTGEQEHPPGRLAAAGAGGVLVVRRAGQLIRAEGGELRHQAQPLAQILPQAGLCSDAWDFVLAPEHRFVG